MTTRRLLPITAIAIAFAFPASATPLGFNVGALFSDQSQDAIFLTRDRNGDGDAADAGETKLFFGDGNASGLADPTGNVFTLHQGKDGNVYAGDGNTDTVYRLRDLNGDNDAQDAGEASVWFSGGNASGFPLLTPNGLAEGNDGAIYIVEADTVSAPNGDFVYRTQDLNNDGDANDAGEATKWLDLKALNPSSSAFEITFSGDDAFIADTAGGDVNRIYRARDTDSSGAIDNSEVEVFIDGDNPFGVPVDFAITADDGTVYTVDLFGATGEQSIFKLTDLDDSGAIDDASEAIEIWSSDLAPDGFPPGAVFSVAAIGDDLFFTSNGGDAASDNIYRLVDLNNDGDFLDPGETTIWTSRELTGDLPIRPRAIAAFTTVPEPSMLAVFAGGLLLTLGASARRQKSNARPCSRS